MSSTNTTEPGLVSGHAQWAKGAAVESIGNATGSEAWKSSGAEQKAAGVQEMKEAGEARKAAAADGQPGYGKTEEFAGKAVGCEGMVNEGKESERK